MLNNDGNMLICGGSGYIGGSFAYYIVKKYPNLRPVILDNLCNGHHINTSLFHFYECDIADSNKVKEIILKHDVKIVFHFSAFLKVEESVSNPLKYYENNVAKSISLLKTITDCGVKHFIFSSSASVYGQPDYIPVDENHPTAPISPYGMTKLMFENILSDYAKANQDFSYISLRYFNVAGTISKKIRHGQSTFPSSDIFSRALDVVIGVRPFFTINGTDYDTPDGTCIRDYIDLKDLCEAHLLAMNYLHEKKQSHVINLGTKNGISVRQLIDQTEKVCKQLINVKEGVRRPGDPSQVIASNSLALKLLNWTPKRTINQTIFNSWKWHQIKYEENQSYLGFDLLKLITNFKLAFLHSKQNFSLQQEVESRSKAKSLDKNNPEYCCFRLFFAPGRINLIGEHIDYNGGLVFPCAINAGTYILCRPNNQDILNFSSEHFSDKFSIDLSNSLNLTQTGKWSDYLIGCVKELQAIFPIKKGFDAHIWGDLPIGAGVSSSASFCLVILKSLIEMNDINLSTWDKNWKVKLALIAKSVENNFVGVNCGIMDPFIITNGEFENAMLLDCGNLKFEHVPIRLGDHGILLCNTNLKRELRTSKYGERYAECQTALAKLQKIKIGKNLIMYEDIELDLIEKVLDDPILFARVKHVLSENKRVKKAFEFIKHGDLIEFGKILTESGRSLKEDYEVTGNHLDWIVEAAIKSGKVLGCRMMGAGFGGCVIILAKKADFIEIKKVVSDYYKPLSGFDPTFYEFSIGQGVHEIKF